MLTSRHTGCAAFFDSDWGSHDWYPPEAHGKVDKINLAPCGSALKQLDIETIPAYWPEAQGHSERVCRTYQSQWPQELVAASIASLAGTKRYCRQGYQPVFNATFKAPTTAPRLGLRALCRGGVG